MDEAGRQAQSPVTAAVVLSVPIPITRRHPAISYQQHQPHPFANKGPHPSLAAGSPPLARRSPAPGSLVERGGRLHGQDWTPRKPCVAETEGCL